MRRSYTLLLWMALPFATLLVAWRGLREREYWRGWGARFGYGASRAQPGSVWVHAVSVGEAQVAIAVIAALRARHPGRSVTLTCATPAGRARAREALGADVDVRYAPYDLPGAVRRTLARLTPSLLVVIETELWPNLLHACLQAGVPVVIASARVSVRSAARLMRLPGLLRAPLERNTWVAAQTAADAQRFRGLGVPEARLQVAGNIKFDFEVAPAIRERGSRLRAHYAAGRPVWVAGSTHAGEDEIVLEAQRRIREVLPGALLVLAPRHRQRFDEVAALLEAENFSSARRTTPAPGDALAQVLLLDTIGELPDFYAAADIAFVGGSLMPVGGHNLLEPASLQLPVLTGPQQFNSPDSARLLDTSGGLTWVRDAPELARAALALLQDPQLRRTQGTAAAGVVAANRGALQQLLRLIDVLLNAPAPAQ